MRNRRWTHILVNTRIWWINMFLATMLLTSQLLSQVALAQYTQEPCDGNYKYWCFLVDWTPQGTDNELVNWRGHEGGLGGSAAWWQRWITQDWRYSGGTWTFLGGWAPGSYHTDAGMVWDSISSQRSVSGGEAVVRLQNKYCDHQPGGGCSGYTWCSAFVDFHLDVVSTYSPGPSDCLTPQY